MRAPLFGEERAALNRRGTPKKRREKRYDPLKPVGGFQVQASSPFERLIHHKAAFTVVSIVGGLVFLFGVAAAYLVTNQTSARTNGNAVRSDTPVLPGSDQNGAAAGATATPGPSPTPAPQRDYTNAPPFTIDPTANYTATIHTDKGDVVIKLDAKSAPQTVNDFVFLAQNRFYDGLSFQRVQAGEFAQAGATSPDGSGGAGYTVPIEDSALPHDTGAVSTALTASKGNVWEGSQFYIALKPLPQQNGKDTVFGTVTQGLDILQGLASRDPQQATTPGLQIQSITISKS